MYYYCRCLCCIFLQLEVTAYQPVDVVTRTVEVPVTRTVDVYVPKPVIKEKIVEVPKLIPKYIEKVFHDTHPSPIQGLVLRV